MNDIHVTITLHIDGVRYTPRTDGGLVSEERRCKVGQVRAIGGELYHCSRVEEPLCVPWEKRLTYWTPVNPDAWGKVHKAIHTACACFP
jgi:hypothetical protein